MTIHRARVAVLGERSLTVGNPDPRAANSDRCRFNSGRLLFCSLAFY